MPTWGGCGPPPPLRGSGGGSPGEHRRGRFSLCPRSPIVAAVSRVKTSGCAALDTRRCCRGAARQMGLDKPQKLCYNGEAVPTKARWTRFAPEGVSDGGYGAPGGNPGGSFFAVDLGTPSCALTQQKLCYFVAFVWFKINRLVVITSRTHSGLRPTKYCFCFVWSPRIPSSFLQDAPIVSRRGHLCQLGIYQLRVYFRRRRIFRSRRNLSAIA